jgi:Fur family iron response transcriptional regulator
MISQDNRHVRDSQFARLRIQRNLITLLVPKTETKRMSQISSGKIMAMLRQVGLKPTRQRMELAQLMYGEGDRHISAESLHAEALAKRIQVSLATVYNALNQFTAAGLLREVAIEGKKAYFDTNTSNHSHYYIEHEGRLTDIPSDDVRVVGLPKAPDGMHIKRVDVIVRLGRN